MYSLKNKITRNLTINMVIVMSGLSIIMYFSMQQLLQDYVLTRLQDDAESLISVVQQDQEQQWQVLPGRMSTVYDRVRSGHYYQVSIGSQVIVSRSLFDAEFPMMDKDSGISGHYLVQGSGQEGWLVWFQQVRKNGQVIEIRVAEDIKPVEKQLIQYTAYAFALVFMVTTILVYLQQRTLYTSFSIFEWLRQNLSSIRHKEIDQSGMQIPREIVPLVNEIEKLVEQLRSRIERTRRAIGNLSHELKRPIQLLSLQQENEDSSERSKPLEEIKKIVERELKRAKISGSPRVGGDFNLAEEIQYMIEIMRKIYPLIQVRLECHNLIETLELDRDDMLELIGNLLDNACKFASGKATLKIDVVEHMLKLIFEDDGEGLNIEQMEQVKQRGVRLDETVEGHGLGMGICRDILDNYRGKMSFSESRLGGLKVYVEIPLDYLE